MLFHKKTQVENIVSQSRASTVVKSRTLLTKVVDFRIEEVPRQLGGGGGVGYVRTSMYWCHYVGPLLQ